MKYIPPSKRKRMLAQEGKIWVTKSRRPGEETKYQISFQIWNEKADEFVNLTRIELEPHERQLLLKSLSEEIPDPASNG